MYRYINTRMLTHGCAVLAYYDGQYHVDVYQSNGASPIYTAAFPCVSQAKQWREYNAQNYTTH